MANSRSDARKWLDKAGEDLQAADRLLSPPPLPNTACFHAQQAAEKALKAVAVYLGAQDIPKTHDLLKLADLIRSLDGQVPFVKEDFARLQPYAVDGRYPRSIKPSEGAAGEAVGLAHDIYQWAQGYIS